MALAAPTSTARFGELLRTWRLRRRLSQMELGEIAEVSPRHLSFIENGRARPSREMVIHLAIRLNVPLRDRNVLLAAAGFAPVYGETPLSAPTMHEVRSAVGRVLRAHEPFPAIAVDRHWNIVDSNATSALLVDDVAEELLRAPVNAIRLSLHPRGLAARVVNFDAFAGHLITRLRRQIAIGGDDELEDLLREALTYAPASRRVSTEPAPDVIMPIRLRWRDTTVDLFSTIAVFGSPVDVTTSELAIETFWPADERTAVAIRRR